ncbi:SDR family NAD(P)-dependent oxidoreductase [Sphingopyxis sp. GW247-27LB]|uniref:SDR family NAD(P)-dependent oxidoreductase n=1 Tax=Sphingopyxis sp. GW247-27LB TaxID=2012632 RepID=UPI000BA51AEC|nr:SDR family NAD(P)-dependent oxidoreductase [Sphingopyxis sp. GW247-27LB]PAL21494.1 3-hydroxyacyl-CoA dehydrogenase [Sphingopyxis sp. GW247-27LB]
MNVEGHAALVTGGASGLGRATAELLAKRGAKIVIVDLPQSAGQDVAKALGGVFVPADVTDEAQMRTALDAADSLGALRAVVHCAGRGATLRVLDRDGMAASLEIYESIVRINLTGTFNVLRLAAERMAKVEPVDGERGALVLTASIAAYEGQIGQIPYASSKAGIVGMTLVAARDLAQRLIRVAAIAPGIFDTPILDRLPIEIKDKLGAAVPHPARLGRAQEFAALAVHIVENAMINGETIRLDGAVRMPPR